MFANLPPLIRVDSLNHTPIPAVNDKRQEIVMDGEGQALSSFKPFDGPQSRRSMVGTVCVGMLTHADRAFLCARGRLTEMVPA
jgi:hypothetical protein